jgi:HK97 family phage major capsid protein
MEMVDTRSGKLVLPRTELQFPHEKRTDYPLTTADTTAYTSYLIPTLIWGDLVRHLNAQSGVLRAGPTIIRTAGNQTINVPILLTDASATAGAESTAATHSTYPVFSYVALKAFREEGLMYVTDEAQGSTEFPILTILNEVAGRALAVKAATDYALGAGSTAPDGLFISVKADCNANCVTAASQTTVTADELLQTMFKLHGGYRAVGSWVVSQPMMQVIAGIKDDEGRYLMMASMSEGVSDRLFGRPIFEDAYADANGAIATGEEHVVFGDMSKFWIRYAGNLVIEASREFHFDQWETAIRFALWHDCNVVDVAAFSVITQA